MGDMVIGEGQSSAFCKYLTISNRDRRWGIYCTCAGVSRIMPGSPYPLEPAQHPAKYIRAWRSGPGNRRVLHDEYQMIYITRGGGTFYEGDKPPQRIVEGDVFFLFPHIPHWYTPFPQTGWDEHWAGFYGAYPSLLARNRFLSPARSVIHVGLSESILRDFVEILELARTEPPAFQQRMGALAAGILAKFLSYSQRRELGSETEGIVNRARCLFEENVTGTLNVHQISARVGVDYSILRKVFKDYTGLSPYQYFLQLKINRAKGMLEEGALSIKEIAYELGFDTQYYFSRIFKKKTGRSPSEWQGLARNRLAPSRAPGP